MNEKLNLITSNLQEVVDIEKIKEILDKRDLKIYWGTAPTGSPSFGYLVPLYKIADFLKADCEVTILFADLHAYLDSMKSTWGLLESRTEYYKFLITELLISIGVSTKKLKFVKGTSYQLKEDYTLDLYKLSAITSFSDSKKSGAEVVKQSENPKLSGLLYPLLQALDEVYLNADAQFGGLDQRKIFMFARDNLPKINYEKRIHLMNPLIPGLGKTGKMSSSEPESKIDFFDSDKTIRNKINKAFCQDKVIDGNGLLPMLKYVLFHKIHFESRGFIINRPDKFGGAIKFENYEKVEEAFINGDLSSIDLKQGISEEIIKFIEPIREKLFENIHIYNAAYPENKIILNNK
ncbi:MAG: tyrosine--tRNA ligase [Candidatus Woesearchaeota archaeon]|jgi:tyrosyl-tRNA synthetase|nr:tyrosine--tRNA ligase [Candidatus Woesearchaeota archaeon]